MTTSALQAWRMYWFEVLTLREVAERLDTSVNTLARLWKHWGFPTRSSGPTRSPKRLTAEDIDAIVALAPTTSQAEIAREFGVSRSAVHQVIRKYL
jgi:predicted DNA-binding protein YlxM (UPF0122 family)